MGVETKLTSNGQITIPRSIRAQLGWKPGDQITIAVLDGGAVSLRRVAVGPPPAANTPPRRSSR